MEDLFGNDWVVPAKQESGQDSQDEENGELINQEAKSSSNEDVEDEVDGNVGENAYNTWYKGNRRVRTK